MALHDYQYGNPLGKPRGTFEMEAIQMLTAKLDQISHKVDNMQVNQVATSSMSCGASGMMGHQAAECLQFNRDVLVGDVNVFNTQTAGDLYTNLSNPNWGNDLRFPTSNVNFPPPSFQNLNRSFGFSSHPSSQVPMQIAPTVPQKSRTEELLEQFILSQQQKDRETDQKFSQLFSKFEQLQAHNNMIESQIVQLSAGPSQRDDGELPSQPEANPREGVTGIILRSTQQLESREPDRKIEQHMKTLASELPLTIDSCLMVDMQDRFMELTRRSPTTELMKVAQFAQQWDNALELRRSKQEQLQSKGYGSLQVLQPLPNGVVESGQDQTGDFKLFENEFVKNYFKTQLF